MTDFSRKQETIQTLRRWATSGTMSVVGGLAASNMLRIVSSIVLTRLLTADAFGVVSLITSVAFIFSMLSDIGTFSFIIRHHQHDSRFLDEVWTLRLGRSVLLTVVMALSSWPIALFLDKPILQPVLAVWSVSFLIDGLSSLSFANAVRRGLLWRLSFFELATGIVSLILSIIFAVAIGSYWALVIAGLINAVLKTLLSYLMFPDEGRRVAFSRERANEVWRFSRLIAASSILSMLLMQADKLVFARVLPLSIFGMYAIAANLALAPGALASLYASRILFPVFSHYARTDRERLPVVYYERQKFIPRLYTFAVGGMIGCAPLVVELLYDPRYRGVAGFLSLLAISPMLMMATHIADQALIAIGRVRATLSANVGRIVWLSVGGFLGYWFGGAYGLIAIVGTMEAAGLVVYWWELSRVGLLDLRQEAVTLAAGGSGVLVGSLFSKAVLRLAGVT